ncbi:MAG: hypothetical protein QOE64_1943 [Frankiales bacterium]|nr:hypothetical protein [Frankiales bacterium]
MIDAARLRRLARRPPSYLARRAVSELRGEARRIRVGAATHGRGGLTLGRILPAPEATVLETTQSSCLRLGAWKEGADYVARDPVLRGRAERRAQLALEPKMELFGDEPVVVRSPPPWLEDVRSGHAWPPKWHRRINYRNIDRPSDVKVCWELSRLRHAVALAQWVSVSGDEPPPMLEEDVRDWARTNPMGWTVNWTCAMEVALRAVNLICVDGALLAAGRTHLRPLLVRMLYQHGWFLARNLEISDVNGNHFLADAVGLVWLGLYFDGIGEAPRWLAEGRSMVTAAAAEQVLADGLDHEGSLRYHALVLEMFLAARAVDPELSTIDATLADMASALSDLVGADGRVPDIGDDDGGRVLALSDAPSWDGRRVLGLAAGLLGVASLSRAGDEWPEDVLWLIGPNARRPAAPAGGQRPTHFPAAGLVVLGGGSDHVVVDVGPVGFRSRGGHGHLDAMSFEAVLEGALAVRDSGTGSYTGDATLREELRDAKAHSVVVIDDMRYAALGGPDALWRIDGDSPPVVVTLNGDASSQSLVVRQALPAALGSATHTRTLTWSPGSLELRDEVRAPAGARIEAFLQLPAGVERAGGALRGDAHLYEVELPPEAELEVVDRRTSAVYGTVEMAPRARVTAVAGKEGVNVTWRISVR